MFVLSATGYMGVISIPTAGAVTRACQVELLGFLFACRFCDFSWDREINRTNISPPSDCHHICFIYRFYVHGVTSVCLHTSIRGDSPFVSQKSYFFSVFVEKKPAPEILRSGLIRRRIIVCSWDLVSKGFMKDLFLIL